MTVDLPASARALENAPIAHHSATDTAVAARGQAGQEKLLLADRRDAAHQTLYHCKEGVCQCGVRACDTHWGHPRPRLTGAVEVQEAEGWIEVLELLPLTGPQVLRVQEEGEVGQKEIPEPGGLGGLDLQGLGAGLQGGTEGCRESQKGQRQVWVCFPAGSSKPPLSVLSPGALS